jgi:hypothetical protein
MKSTTSLLSFLVLLGILFASCASLDERMAKYVGQHRDELVNNWGPPHEETKLKKGGTRIVYYEQNPLIHPNQIIDPALSNCEKIFITDSRGIIKSYRHENCG